MGLEKNGAVIELFVSETGTFTILMSYPNGLNCIIAAGENGEAVPAPQGGTGL